MSVGNSFRCNVSGREYTINSSFTCDSSGIAYVLDCKACGKQYIVSTFAPFRVRFNSYESSGRTFSTGISVTQAELFRHFTKDNHHGFLEDISVQIIYRVFGDSGLREGL